MEHRIFIALKISDEFKDAIFNWEDQFESENRETFSKIHWLSEENLHITIVPPWYEDDKGVERVKDLLRSINKQRFTLEFKRITYGPDPKKPRLVWIEGDTTKKFADLKDNVFKVLKQKPDNRPLKLHLTIGRFRPENFSSFSVKEINEDFIFREEAKFVLLIESHLLETGAKYDILEQVVL